MFLVRPYIGLVKEVGIQSWADVSFLWMVTFDEGWWERDEIGEEVSSLQVGKKKERKERSINERLEDLADSESSNFKHDRLRLSHMPKTKSKGRLYSLLNQVQFCWIAFSYI